MVTYCVLSHPGVSQVFFDASKTLALSEMELLLRALSVPCENLRAQEMEGLLLYAFDSDTALGDADIRRLGALSCLYALFVQEGACLRPVARISPFVFDEDLSSIPKYTGKTNVQFTRMMLHMAELSLQRKAIGNIRLLDPVAGRGTTLYEAAMRGWDACGIEIVPKAAHETAIYFQKYLETKRIRHKPRKEKMHGALSWSYAFAQDKDALRDNPSVLTMVSGDAKLADTFFGKQAFDIIAGDLPYGVAHGNIVGAKPQRSPEALLHACLPAWHRALRTGGVLSLSWNVHVFSADKMAQTLSKYGFDPLREAPYDQLSHRVDASIQRDIAMAIRRA